MALALLLGLGLGLAYSWLISPVKYVDASPSILRADFKDQYRLVIAAAYQASHDLERARARLALLGDADPMQGLSAQAQQMLAAGESSENVESVAQLASDLQSGIAFLPPTPTLVATAIETFPVTSQPVSVIETAAVEETPVPTDIFETPLALASPTLRPTQTPSPLPGRPFALVGQDTVCDATLSEGLLQVLLLDSRRREVPGIEIIVTWNEGEDRFFTGFKPELGNGYADFQMEDGIVYSIQVIESGAPVPNISIPICTDADGREFRGGILLTFQR
jgi:hypothetical protein